MRYTVLCFALMLLPTAAFAAEGRWTAEMQEDEGGPAMVASVSAKPVGDLTPTLSLMCAGTEGVNLRYEMPMGDAEPASEADIMLKTDKAEITQHVVFEEMDGAFAAYFQPTDPTIDLLKTGKEVVVSVSPGKGPALTFPLTGSSKAIDTLLKSCN